MTAPSQIPLSFPVTTSYRRDDFMPAPCNADALAWIDRWPDWPYPALIIYGAEGCGKTHLLSLWMDKVGERHHAIDDVQSLFGNAEQEEELFHLFNLARENGTSLLLAMDKPVAQQAITLPDLASRLRAAPQVEVQEPDDTALQGVIIKLCHDRQLRIPPDVVAYILPRIERRYAAVRSLVDRIDKASLAEKRSVTIPLVKKIIDSASI